MAKYVDGVSLTEIFDKVMACGIEDTAENRLYLEQALEAFCCDRFDVRDFMLDIWSVMNISPSLDRLIEDAVRPYEGMMVYSVDTTLVARIQEANLRAVAGTVGMDKDDGMEIATR